jgi:hypothetical protein
MIMNSGDKEMEAVSNLSFCRKEASIEKRYNQLVS